MPLSQHHCSTVLSLLIPALLSSLCAGAPAPVANWSVGVAAVKITPQKPVVLAGYASRTKPHESVIQDIYAKALALRDTEGHQAVLVTADLCIIPTEVAQGIRDRIVEKTKLEPAAVLLSLSHTHSGPAVALKSEPDGASVNRSSPETIEYTQWFQEQAVQSAVQALANLKPANLSWGTGMVNFVMNRRQFTERGVVLGVNPRGPVDRSVPVLRVDSPDGKPMAVLFACACHNTTMPSNGLGICGDYAGYAKEYVERQLPGVQALFMMGCGGDANPQPRQRPLDAQANGEELGREVCRVMETKLAPVRGPLSYIVENAELPLQKTSKELLHDITQDKTAMALKKSEAQRMLALLEQGQTLPTTHRAPVSAWQFGNDLTLIGLPNEVVVDYVHALENAIGPLRLWVAGYCHEVVGYIPSKRVLREGGYETRGLYLGSGWFTPGVEDALVEAAKTAAAKAGRKIQPIQ